MKKKMLKTTKTFLIKELVWIVIDVIFNGAITFLSSIISKQSQLLSSAMERHEVSRMEFEFVNNFQNVCSNIQIFGNVIILGIIVFIVIKHCCK